MCGTLSRMSTVGSGLHDRRGIHRGLKDVLGMRRAVYGVLRRLRDKLSDRPDISVFVRQGLRLGRRVDMGGGVSIGPVVPWLVSIGDECTPAENVIIFARDASTERHLGYTKAQAVSIGCRTFIGAGSITLPGVRIGNNVIVGAGSVAMRDGPDGAVAAGNPARVLETTKSCVDKHKRRMTEVRVLWGTARPDSWRTPPAQKM